MNVAAVDIGSTSIRLLITGSGGDVARRAVVTRFGDGVGDGGSLDPARAEATLEVLAAFRESCDAAGVIAGRAVATSVVRRASDGEAFLDRAGAVLGFRPEVISGKEEGDLSFAGATAAPMVAGRPGPFTVIDLGGGSCEFAHGLARCEAVFSAEFGAARLTERWIEHDPPRPEELVACLSVVEAHLDDVRREVLGIDATKTWIGVGGTLTTFAAVDIGLPVYDRSATNGYVLQRDAAEDVFRTLVTEPYDHRIHNPGLPTDRAHVILGGACAVVGIMRGLRIDELVVSDADLLDGIAAELAG